MIRVAINKRHATNAHAIVGRGVMHFRKTRAGETGGKYRYSFNIIAGESYESTALTNPRCKFFISIIMYSSKTFPSKHDDVKKTYFFSHFCHEATLYNDVIVTSISRHYYDVKFCQRRN